MRKFIKKVLEFERKQFPDLILIGLLSSIGMAWFCSQVINHITYAFIKDNSTPIILGFYYLFGVLLYNQSVRFFHGNFKFGYILGMALVVWIFIGRIINI